MSVSDSRKRRSLPSVSSSLALLSALRYEQSDPDRFYRLLAEDTADIIQPYINYDGKLVLEVGSGPGDLSEAIRARGGKVLAVDRSWEEIHCRRRSLESVAIADGCLLPVRDGTFDLVCSSNVLEHVPTPSSMVSEMIRVARPGGIIYFNYTTWLSPFGGHETSPWHFFGGRWAAARYTRKNGHPPKNFYGESLFPVGVRTFRKMLAREIDGIVVVDMFSRYLPRWLNLAVHVPILSELSTLNLAVVMCKKDPAVRSENNHESMLAR